jgi:hypothetical protein
MSQHSENAASGGYFHEVNRLKSLRGKVSTATDPVAADLVRMLDCETAASGYEPVGALATRRYPDDFLKDNLRFAGLEERLARKIVPENVSEVFDLVGQTAYYTPTHKVIHAFMNAFLLLLARQSQQQAPGLRTDVFGWNE